MIIKQTEMNLSPYLGLYDMIIPKDNFFRMLNELVDFSFVYTHLKENYSEFQGRPAKDIIFMFKILIVKEVYQLSDVNVVDRILYDMAIKAFLGLAPEETDLINPSSLTKFRRTRIKSDELLRLLIKKTVELAIEKNVISSKSIFIDATHSNAKENKKKIATLIENKTKSIRKDLYKIDPSYKKIMPPKPSNPNDIDQQIEYANELISTVKSKISVTGNIENDIDLLSEFIIDVEDSKVIEQEKGAAVGYKTEDQSFYGYKTHAAITEERIITAIEVTPGNCSDGNYLETLIDQSIENGIEVENVVGDGAYSCGKHIELAEKRGINLVAPVNPILTNAMEQTDKKGFIFNKDSNGYICPNGEHSIRSNSKKGKGKYDGNIISYFFDIEKCKTCLLKDGCYKEGASSKSISITITNDIHKNHYDKMQLDENIELRKQRYMIEAKFGELKNVNNYQSARYSGIAGMQLQAGVVVFITNIKRIFKLM